MPVIKQLEKKTVDLEKDLAIVLDLDKADDIDYQADFMEAVKGNDLKTLIAMLTYLFENGDDDMQKIRKYYTERDGKLRETVFTKVLEKLTEALPKAKQSAQKRW